jgi:HK97 family phage prohead protease
MNNAERRFIPIKEIRAVAGDNGALIIEGYPIVYESTTELWPGMREVIARGAATKALARSSEIVLWNHDPSQPMARRSNGTLEVKEDDHGVFIRADVSKTVWGRQGHESVSSLTTDKMSFAFDVAPAGEEWKQVKEGDKIIDIRRIVEFGVIYDYSPVSYPAYPDTEIIAKSRTIAVRNKPQPEASGGGDPTGELQEREELDLRIKQMGG